MQPCARHTVSRPPTRPIFPSILWLLALGIVSERISTRRPSAPVAIHVVKHITPIHLTQQNRFHQTHATRCTRTPTVDTTLTCTRADAHFSRAHITVRNSHIDPHFSNMGTSISAQGKGHQCRAFLQNHSHLVVMSLSSTSLLSLHGLLVLCHDPHRHRHTCRSTYACVVEAHESTRKHIGRNPTQRSCRSHCRQGIEFVVSVQSCS